MTNGQINPPSPPTTFGVIFMGGESRRLGQEKASVELAGMTLLDRIVDRLSPQCAQLALSVRRAGDGLEGLDEVGMRDRTTSDCVTNIGWISCR